MARRTNITKLKKALKKSNTKLLLSAVMLFQCVSALLLAFKGDTVDMQAMMFAVAIPAVTWLVSTQITRLWPVDRAIIIMTLFLCSIGIITLKDIARSDITSGNQAKYAVVGIFAMMVGIVLIRRFKSWKKLTPWFMVICLAALATPFILGEEKYGATNWITIAGFSLQPSEFMKPVIIVILASGLSNRPRFIKTLPTLAFSAVCCGILLVQKDLGALLLYFLTTVAMFFVATSNGLITLAGLGLGSCAAVAAYKLFPHVQQRIAMWQNPWSDPQVYGYQIVQALIAIGSGGLFGMGLGLGSPRNIPLYHSDFIFAALTEEFGLIFSVCLLIIYVMIIMRGLIIAMNARTSFHSLTSLGIVCMLGLQTMLIVGGNTKLLPLTGVTLPLISSGGSSLVSTFFSIGILTGISSMNAEDEARDIELIELSQEAML